MDHIQFSCCHLKMLLCHLKCMLNVTYSLIAMQPPSCGSNAVERRRRDANNNKDGGTPATIEVYSGLYVNEATDIKGDVSDDIAREKVIGTLLK